MGIKRLFKNLKKNYLFKKNKRTIKINHFELDFFTDYQFAFNKPTDFPEVSIIIPVFNQLQYTLNCLYSIENHDKQVLKEIIIINDNSTDESSDYLSKIENITIINNTENLGFLKNINLGINNAKGKYIYILNNDTEVQENYLKTLLEVFKVKKNVGAVGSKMIFSNNTLQEAGCLIFKDCEIVNLGRFDSIDNPKYNFLRKVDYSSGCSLLFKRLNETNTLNLLDEEFLPAYYEETDLCQRLKYDQDLDIYYQPKSEILHFENISYTGENIAKTLLLEKNSKKFKERWNSKFSDEKYLNIKDKQYLNINKSYNKPSIIFLEESTPKYDRDSGSRRLFEIFKILLANGNKISLGVSNFHESDKSYINYYESIGIEVFQDYVSVKNKIKTATYQIKKNLPLFDIIWIFRPNGFKQWYSCLKNNISTQKIIYDMVDLHYLRMEREKEYLPILKKTNKRIQQFKAQEYFAMQTADAVVAISNNEKEIVTKNGIDQKKIHIVSNFHDMNLTNNKSFDSRKGLLFIGSFRHLPNIDALKFLREQIMPIIWEKNKDIFVNVIGADLPDELIQKYNSEQFRILGFQESVDEWFTNSRVFVAPLRYGAGVKGKIGQALEFELPIVTTPVGVEGMNLQNNVHVLVNNIDDAQGFADNILRLYSDETLWSNLKHQSKNALNPFSKEEQGKKVLNMISSLYNNN